MGTPEPGDGNSTVYTTPFASYSKSPVVVVGDGDDLVDKGGSLANVANSVFAMELEAAKQTDG